MKRVFRRGAGREVAGSSPGVAGDADLRVALERTLAALRSVNDGVVLADERGAVVFSNLSGVVASGDVAAELVLNREVAIALREALDGAATGPARVVEVLGPPRRSLEVTAVVVRPTSAVPAGLSGDGSASSRAGAVGPSGAGAGSSGAGAGSSGAGAGSHGAGAGSHGAGAGSHGAGAGSSGAGAGGALLGAVAVIEDVSFRNRTDAIRRDFVSNISHELRTPVGALSVLAETMQLESSPDVLKRLALRMEIEAQRMSVMIDDLMLLSTIEGDQLSGTETMSAFDLAQQAADRAASAAELRKVRIRIDSPGEHFYVIGDRRQLVTALHNLIDNAVKYSDPDSDVVVTMEQELLSGQSFVAFAVADTGMGIPLTDRERIFERFYRVDRARARDTGGTGLGLAIVRHVATNHGGEIAVKSIEGYGSTFTLRIPATAGSAGRAT